jgi:hypothetical protein
MNWVLILYIYAGGMSGTDSVALTNVRFTTEKSCIAAGEKSLKLVSGTLKSARYVCVADGDPRDTAERLGKPER